jgi:hypothetical protein
MICIIQKVTGHKLVVTVPPEFEGHHVEIAIRILPTQEPWGEGIKRSAGALAHDWTEEDDRILEAIHEDRKRPSWRELPE